LTACGNRIILCFGRQEKECLNDVWSYDEIGDIWIKLEMDQELPKRFGHSAVAVDHMLFIFGGRDEKENFLNDLVIIDTEMLTIDIRILKVAPSPRMFHSSVYVEKCNEIVVYGGVTDQGIVGSVYAWSLNTGKWRKVVTLAPRMYHRSWVCKGWMVSIGGTDGKKKCRLSFVNTSDWMEMLTMEFGNRPYGLIGAAIVPLSETSLMIYGGTDSLSEGGFMTVYILDVMKGFVELEPRYLSCGRGEMEPN
jgi:N-acetylneuraminic acid mutarotase